MGYDGADAGFFAGIFWKVRVVRQETGMIKYKLICFTSKDRE